MVMRKNCKTVMNTHSLMVTWQDLEWESVLCLVHVMRWRYRTFRVPIKWGTCGSMFQTLIYSCTLVFNFGFFFQYNVRYVCVFKSVGLSTTAISFFVGLYLWYRLTIEFKIGPLAQIRYWWTWAKYTTLKALVIFWKQTWVVYLSARK